MSGEMGLVVPFRDRETGSSAALERRVAALVRRYAEQRTVETADALIRTLDRLVRHPDFPRDTHTRGAFARMRAHWKMLAFLAQEA